MRSVASFDSPPVETSRMRSLAGRDLGDQCRKLDDRPRQDRRVEMIQLSDVAAGDGDDLRMAVAEDGAHLSRGEVEDALSICMVNKLPTALSAIVGENAPP